MWIERTSVLLTTLGIASCGVGSGGYGDLRADYEETSYTPHPRDDGRDLFADQATLAIDPVVAAVLERNPDIEVARQGWRRALAAYPQATSFDDPRVGLTVAPLSFFDSDVRIGFGAEVSQPLPYPGKRRLRGQAVLAEAEAARADLRAVKQRLALMAAQLYYDYFFVERALAVNAEHIDLLREYGETIASHLATGKAWQEDALKVDVDLASLHEERAALASRRDVTVTQLNALLHRPPRAPLPPPPADLVVPAAPGEEVESLEESALARRPELRAIGSRERAAEARVDLAGRDYYPDLRLTGSYNRMWPMLSHQFMVGIAFDLPVMRERRDAATDAARASRARQQAELSRATDEVLRDVATSYRRVEEADEAAAIYRDRAIPAAESRVDAIRLGLDAGRTSFLEVIRAERELRATRLRYYAAVSNAYRRRAELDWAVGRRPGQGFETKTARAASGGGVQ